jgi:hypothetical protein
MKKVFYLFFMSYVLSYFSNAIGADYTLFVVTLKSGAKFETFNCNKYRDRMSFTYRYGRGTVTFPIEYISDIRELLAEGYLDEEKPETESKSSEELILNPLQMANNIAQGSVNKNASIGNENSSNRGRFPVTPIHLSSSYKWGFGVKQKYWQNGEEWVHIVGELEPKNNKREIVPLLFRYFDLNDSIVAEKTIMPKEMKIDDSNNKHIYTISDRLPVSKSPARVEISVIRHSKL